jgi:hypothetical protein
VSKPQPLCATSVNVPWVVGEDVETWRCFTCHREDGHDGDHAAEAGWDEDDFTWDDDLARQWDALEANTSA